MLLDVISPSAPATRLQPWSAWRTVRIIRAESGDLQPPGRTAERADRPVAQYRARVEPPDLIAGGATAREEDQ